MSPAEAPEIAREELAWWEVMPGAGIVCCGSWALFGLAVMAAAVGPHAWSSSALFAVAAAATAGVLSTRNINEALDRWLEEERPRPPAPLAPLDVEEGYDGPPLARCICGRHYACPDGWHPRAQWPCDCTPDCALDMDEEL